MSSYVAVNLSYVFSPSAGTISFASQPNFNPRYLKAIIDQTQNAFIYLPGVQGYAGTWDSTGTILTLSISVSSYGASDLLIFQYDDQQNALATIAAAFTGPLLTNGLPAMKIPGARVHDVHVADLIKSLIVEVRMLTQLVANMAREDVDLNAYKRQILEQLQ